MATAHGKNFKVSLLFQSNYGNPFKSKTLSRSRTTIMKSIHFIISLVCENAEACRTVAIGMVILFFHSLHLNKTKTLLYFTKYHSNYLKILSSLHHPPPPHTHKYTAQYFTFNYFNYKPSPYSAAVCSL